MCQMREAGKSQRTHAPFLTGSAPAPRHFGEIRARPNNPTPGRETRDGIFYEIYENLYILVKQLMIIIRLIFAIRKEYSESKLGLFSRERI